MNSLDEWRGMLKTYKKALGAKSLKRLHCHLSGIEYGPKGERNHLMLSNSDFDLDGLLTALYEFKCGGRILCESPEDMDVDALLIKEELERVSNAEA